MIVCLCKSAQFLFRFQISGARALVYLFDAPTFLLVLGLVHRRM